MSTGAEAEQLVILPSTAELVFASVALLVVVGVMVGLAIAVARDMNRRDQPGVFWGLLVIFAPVVGLLIWAALRNNWPRVEPGYRAG